MSDWTRLISGSDIRGVAIAEPGKPATLTEDIGEAVGAAFARWLAQRQAKPQQALTIAVGRDSRLSGEALQGAMMRGLAAGGARVLDCGLCTTPAMFMSTVLLGTGGAVMVTASHLPWQRNGYKFFTPGGGLDGKAIRALLEDAQAQGPQTSTRPPEQTNLLGVYVDFLREKAESALGSDAPLRGLHVVVDAGNGAGGFYADMLRALGADTTGSQYLEPDGRFPGHIPNPEEPAAMASLSGAVQRAGADLGVLFDADCDRAAMVDGDGREINRNRLIALVAAVLLREDPGATVVTDSVTSAGLDAFIQAHGGTLHRFKRGYRNVIDEAVRLNEGGVNCPLAMETSGHAALRENRFLDDGMYLMTRLIIEAQRLAREGRTLQALIADLREPREEAEIRLPILVDNFRAAGEAALLTVFEAVEAGEGLWADPRNHEGIRVCFGSPDSWTLLRLSVHDPLLVINAESDQEGGVQAMLASLYDMLSAQPAIDLTALRDRAMLKRSTD